MCGFVCTQVFVEWTEMPGSKIRPTSIISMAFELLIIKVSRRNDNENLSMHLLHLNSLLHKMKRMLPALNNEYS